MDITDHGEADKVVASYLDSWCQYYLYYEEFAAQVAKRCDEALKSRDILCTVTYRAKELNELEHRLSQRLRYNAQWYKSEEDIENDIQDLAGVRIDLYWPRDRDVVHSILYEVLDIESFAERGDISDSSIGEFAQRLRRYSAHQYVARLKQQDLADSGKFARQRRSEIQVGSAFRHTLADMEHNIGYQHVSGPLTHDVYDAIDYLGGLIQDAENCFDEFVRFFDEKKASDDLPFRSNHHLGVFLSNLVSEFPQDYKEVIGPLEGLTRLLRLQGLDNPNTVRVIYSQMRLVIPDVKQAVIRAYECYMQPCLSVRMMDYLVLYDGSTSEQYDVGLATAKEVLAVIISTFIWLNELFQPTLMWQRKLLCQGHTYEYEHKVRHKDLPWLGAMDPRELLLSSTIDAEDEERLRGIAWWFGNHDERSIKLAFRVSTLRPAFSRDLDKEWYLFEDAFEGIRRVLYAERKAVHNTK